MVDTYIVPYMTLSLSLCPSAVCLSIPASMFLIYMDTLMGQIEDIVKKEKRKQAWVPVTRDL